MPLLFFSSHFNGFSVSSGFCRISHCENEEFIRIIDRNPSRETKPYTPKLQYHITYYKIAKNIQFMYSNSNSKDLVELRKKYDLDSIAGNGSEIYRIINLMKRVHNLTFHSPNPSVPEEMNSLVLLREIEDHQKRRIQ